MDEISVSLILGSSRLADVSLGDCFVVNSLFFDGCVGISSFDRSNLKRKAVCDFCAEISNAKIFFVFSKDFSGVGSRSRLAIFEKKLNGEEVVFVGKKKIDDFERVVWVVSFSGEWVDDAGCAICVIRVGEDEIAKVGTALLDLGAYDFLEPSPEYVKRCVKSIACQNEMFFFYGAFDDNWLEVISVKRT